MKLILPVAGEQAGTEFGGVSNEIKIFMVSGGRGQRLEL